jgi:prepilin-type N-terminal cleavage/methylation domain-containing protein
VVEWKEQEMRHNSLLNPISDIRHPKFPSGFTLLELTVVLFLMALVLGLSPFFLAKTLSSTRLNASGRDLSATIRQARSLAQFSGTTQSVLLNLDTNRYGIEGRGIRNIPLDIRVRVIDPFFGEVQSGTYRMLFDPAGGVEAATIDLSNGKRMIRIVTDPIVGTVTLKQ